jgi:hypothetical protein
MKSLRRLGSATLLLLTAVVAHPQQAGKIDAQTDGFAGPVKSVSTSVARAGIDWHQPDGPTIYEPIFCHECEYDADGTRTKLGQTTNGQFNGEVFKLIRDSTGRVAEEFCYDAQTSEVEAHQLMGPFGFTEEDLYIGGKQSSREIRSYDEAGHLVESQAFDTKDELVHQIDDRFDRDGNRTEEKATVKDGKLEWLLTEDPRIDSTRFEHFNESGALALDWTTEGGKLISFWEAPDSPRQMGDGLSDWDGHGNATNFACKSSSQCDVSRIHYVYFDDKKRLYQSAEWRDSDGNLRYAAYYAYEFDSNDNWTRRTVSVVTPELTDRTLYETDTRTITYWP